MVALYARAWIEIRPAGWKSYPGSVALYARAWIELLLSPGDVWGANVALQAEGVDRNPAYAQTSIQARGRPPCGGRG